MEMPVSLQLFTVHPELKKDYFGTLAQVAEAGYQGVELFGELPLEAPAMRVRLAELGLAAFAWHVPPDKLENDLEGSMDAVRELGAKTLVYPFARFDDLYAVQETAERFDRMAERCRENGLRFLYHNHHAELIRLAPDSTLLEKLMELTQPAVGFELDVYWTAYAAVEPVGFLMRHADRIGAVHLRQLESYATKAGSTFAAGCLDMGEIIRAARRVGIEDFVVEQKYRDGDCLRCIREDRAFLRAL